MKTEIQERAEMIEKDRLAKKKEKQVELISIIANINIDAWQSSLPKHEGKLAKKLIDSILSSEGIPTSKQAELVRLPVGEDTILARQ